MVVLGTAHPAKFLDAVESAVNERPDLPPRLASLLDLPERMETLPNELATVQGFIQTRAKISAEKA